MSRVFSALCLGLLLSNCALALDPHRSITQYIVESWHQEDGLPQNHITRIVQTKDGYLWIGTLEGLARFDGIRFTIFEKRNTLQIKHNLIWELLAASDGSLWIGTFGGGVTRYKDGIFQHFGAEDGLSDNIIIALYEDRHKNIWIGTRDGGLNLFRNGRFTSYTMKAGLPHSTVDDIILDRNDHLWFGTDRGLCRLTQGRIKIYTTKDGLPHNTVVALLEDRAGRIWIGTDGGGVAILSNGSFHTYSTENGLTNNFVEWISEDPQGKIWITTKSGLNSFSNGKIKTYTEANGLSGPAADLLHVDRQGNIWVATNGGLHRFNERGLSALPSDHILSRNAIHSMMEDREGNLWIGTGLGLYRLKDGKVITYTTAEGLPSDAVGALFEDQQGNLWIGSNRGGLTVSRNGVFQPAYAWVKELKQKSHHCIYKDRQNNLWIGTDSGLIRLTQSRVQTFTVQNGLPGDVIRAVTQDSTGNIWIGTGAGIASFKDDRITTYTDALANPVVRFIHEDRTKKLWIGTDGGLHLFQNGKFTLQHALSNPVLRGIYEDAQGSLWMGTIGGGVNVLKEGRFTAFTVKEGLFDDTVFQVLEDIRGNFWMSCNKGIFSAPKKEFESRFKGSFEDIHSTLYAKAEGMRSTESMASVFPSAIKTRDGKLWFSTTGGLVMIQPETIQFNKTPPTVIIEQLIVDSVSTRINQNLSIPSGKDKFEFHYTALSLVAPEKNKFRYILEGFDNAWIEAGTRRTAYYTNIPPGQYTFRVTASNNDGLWNISGASISFYLQPHFYETIWFYFLCFMSAVALFIAIHRLRIRHIRSKLFAVLEERGRISRDFHDTVAQDLTAISLHLKTVSETIPMDPEIAKKHVDIARNIARDSQSEARRFLQNLRPEPPDSNFGNSMQQLLQQLTAGLPIQTDLSVKGSTSGISPVVLEQILKITREAVNNAIKHSGAHCIEVHALLESPVVQVKIIDDGRGFDVDSQSQVDWQHYGFNSMQERAAQCGGRIQIHSRPGHGTEVLFTVDKIY
ncbi:histidine kinase [bacterium]|nr:histidine kinase [bacterium]MCI0607349.1 histidine kinase [bacterium]